MGYFTCLLVAILVFLSLMQASAMRPLAGEDWVMQKGLVVLQSLQRGTVPSSGPSGCTYIAGSGRGRCTLQHQKSAADHHDSRSSSLPEAVVEFGVASVINKTAAK